MWWLGTVIIIAYAVATMVLSWLCFRRYQAKRPPIGVYNLWDLGLMMVGILLVPYLYLALPGWLLIGLLALASVSLCYFCLEPIILQRRLLWLLVVALVVANVATYRFAGPESHTFLFSNNAVQVLAVVGISNLWAQSGMKARDIALLGAALFFYDYIFTVILPLMDELMAGLTGIPFAPVIVWQVNMHVVMLGLGDLLMITVFPLVMRKAYGRLPGLTALALGVVALVAVVTGFALNLWHATFPLMVVVGPLMLVQFLLWHFRYGTERTTQQYLRSEPKCI